MESGSTICRIFACGYGNTSPHRSVHFYSDENLTVQPLVAAQFYTKTPWLLRAGAEAKYNNRVSAIVFWLNNKTVQAGCGLRISESCEVNLFYGTANPQRVGEQMELGVGLRL